MYLADYHTHTRFSPDGRWTMAEMAQAALDAGLQEICFTDHVDSIIWNTTQLQGPANWPALVADYRQAQEIIGDRITMRLGMELGDAQWDFAHTEKLIADAPELDFVIGSVHILSQAYEGLDLIYFDPKDEAQLKRGLQDYLEQSLRLAKWGRFSVLGHMVLPIRYLNEERGLSVSFDGFEAEIEEILKTLIANGCGIEVNTNRGNAPLPGAKWLQMYRRLGGEIITLGSDAHSTEQVGCKIRERQELLRECGFRRFCTFEKRQPIWHELG